MQFMSHQAVKVNNPKHKQDQRIGFVVGYDLEADQHLVKFEPLSKKQPELTMPVATVDLQAL